jgi:hypothetical protein
MKVKPNKDFLAPLRNNRSYSALVAMRRSAPKPKLGRAGAAPTTRGNADQADKRRRPFARRAAITLRPPRERMRTRNP